MTESRGRYRVPTTEPKNLAEVVASGALAGRRKYGNQPVALDGFHFDSKIEARRYEELKILERGEVITALSVHPRFELVPGFRDVDGQWIEKIVYEGDFAYVECPVVPGYRIIVEDTKGFSTAVFRIKQKLFLFKYGRTHALRVIGRNGKELRR